MSREITRTAETKGTTRDDSAARAYDFVASIGELLDAPLSDGLWQHADCQLTGWLDHVSTLMFRCEIAGMRIIGELARRRADTRGSRGAIVDHLAATSTATPGRARAVTTLAIALDDEPDVLAAYAAGEMTTAQAKLIVGFLAHPPAGMPAAAAPSCRDLLLKAATSGDLRCLQDAREGLRQMFAPDDTPPGEDTDRNEFHASKTLAGRVVVKGDLDAVTGEHLLSALSPLSAPRPEADGSPDRRRASQRRADALTEILRRYQAAATDTGDGRPHIHIHIGAADLAAPEERRLRMRKYLDQGRYGDMFAALRTGWADHTGTLSAHTVRRLACDATITPIITGPGDVPLHLGRTTRLAGRAQRRALAARDRGCAFPACDRPPAWTQAHHIVHWADGGPTDLDNLVLLCAAYHRAVHHDGWTAAMSAAGIPVFRPPATIDPHGRWLNGHGLHTDAPRAAPSSAPDRPAACRTNATDGPGPP